jgi:histidinol phosphatase-like enzyme
MKIRTIAVDFDGTIVEDKYPEIGPLIPEARDVLNKYRALGGQVVLWTCRSGADLSNACLFLYRHGIHVDAINCHIPERLEAFRQAYPHIPAVDLECRKIPADMYIDDRNPGGADWGLVAELLFGGEDGAA